jgi:hypothetical protein
MKLAQDEILPFQRNVEMTFAGYIGSTGAATRPESLQTACASTRISKSS